MKNRKLAVVAALLLVAAVIAIAAKTMVGNISGHLEGLKTMGITDVDVSKLEDGVYKGSYKAFPIEAIVDVTIENHRIKSIDLVKHKHGQGSAAEIIPDMVVDSQTLNVNAVTGATYSSKVILKAIENALIQ